ncbi:hypothetical protein CV102_10570 [Natronococcus pandeyae]|uniref:Polysaccharide deacetylase n=1 Tax=Natronococcus pandeyae TaxID=2055836 RepID=A0A8J8Q797_9EURY|nr:DUF2334 domain-containing protein [Natronococcus pandeyae]TYL38939.1 hypothetical protein CV102_10570 [Natronococcus pandeyae]
MSVRTAAMRALIPAFALAGVSLSTVLPTDDERESADYQTVLIFRNDDLEPGHADELRREIDQIFIDEGVPLTNAPIPIQNEEEPITDDEEFCEELREQYEEHPDIFEYSLHGYYHTPSTDQFYVGDGGFSSGEQSEFGGLPYDQQRSRIEEGRRILEECTGATTHSFVPPFAPYDDATVQALAEEGITIVSSDNWFTRVYFGETDLFETYGVLHVPANNDFVSDWETHEFHDQSYLREAFDEAYENGELYMQTLHYWTFTSDERLDELRSFIDYVKDQDGVLMMTIEAFADAYREERLVQTNDGWTYTPPDDDDELAVYSTGALDESSEGSDDETNWLDSVISAGRRIVDQ